MKSNVELKINILQALKSIKLLLNESIGVSANEGIIVLTGTVDNYIKKIEAVDAVQCIDGVESVIDNIEIQYGQLPKISDDVISFIITNAINWNWEVPYLKITASVLKGQVTIAGEVQWIFQKEIAEEIIVNLAGVRGIINNIHIIATIPDHEIRIAPEKRLHNDGNKVYLLDAAGRLYRKSPCFKPDFNNIFNRSIELN